MIILHPGFLTTIQDRGRYGFQKYGVLTNGAMDPFALRVANILVGNEPDEAAMEITLQGPSIEFTEDVNLAVCGASLSPTLNEQPFPEWRRVFAKSGSHLSFGKSLAGCRAYLAVHGGFDVPIVMGSKSTYLRAGFGGFSGRALQKGDTINVCTLSFGQQSKRNWYVNPAIFPSYSSHPIARVVRGPDFERFATESGQHFLSRSFLISPQSDRMGYRLNGPTLKLTEWPDKLSSAVTLGTIQLPSDGNPIILMADRQTMGGYPCIAQVIGVDIPVLAQLKPGDKLRFQEISLEEAQNLWREQERNLQILRQAVLFKEV